MTGASASPARVDELHLVDWRRRVAALYSAVRAERSPEVGHAIWRRGRDALMRQHPESPLLPDDELRTGVPYWPYDQALRFELAVQPSDEPSTVQLQTGGTDTTALRRVGSVQLPAPIDAAVDVWWLQQYAGGLFLPLRDGTAGGASYGGGRYLLDTAKGADLGCVSEALVVDLNFLYHPSCRYNEEWQCPLAPAGNTIAFPVKAGERM